MFSERHNSLELADTWQHTVYSPASVYLFLPMSLSPGSSVISYCTMKISKTPLHFLKLPSNTGLNQLLQALTNVKSHSDKV